MTGIVFHFNMSDRLGYALRLLRKAAGAASHVVVTADARTLQWVDENLWTFSAHEFIPHCMHSAPGAVVRHSPIVLCEQLQTVPHQEVLLNLGDQVPEGFHQFNKVIELVGLDDHERHHGRLRWKHYTQQGLHIEQHDAGKKTPS